MDHSKRLHRVILLAVFVFHSFSILAQDQPILQSYSMEDGLPHNWVRDVVQDDDGFLWLATLEGLTRFDGYTFKVYPYQNKDSTSIDSDRVITLDLDDEGNLWIARFFFPLERFDPRTGTSTSYTSHSNNLPNDIILEVFFDPPHYVWLGHGEGGGLSRLNKATEEILNFQVDPDSVKYRMVWDVHRDQSGDLWVASDVGLYLFDSLSSNFTQYTYNHLYPDAKRVYYDNINDLTAGKLILETAAGPLIFDKSTGKFEAILDFEDDNYLGIGGYSINHDDDVWISNSPTNFVIDHHRRGLIKYHPDTGDLNLYELDATTPLYLDRSGNIWLHSGEKGISSFNPLQRKFKVYRLKDLRQEIRDDIGAIIQDHSQYLWVGTSDGLYQCKIDGSQRLQLVQDFSSEFNQIPIYCLFEDSKLRLWVGTNQGLYQYLPEKRTFIKRNLNSNVADPIVTSILEDRHGTLWVTGNGLAALESSKDVFQHYHHNNDPIGVLRDIQEDSNGALWFHDVQQIWAFDIETKIFHSFKVPNSNLLGPILLSPSDTLWIGAATGLYSMVIKPIDSLVRESVVIQNHNHLLPMDLIIQIQQYRDDLWVAQPMGLTKINLPTQIVENFYQSDGLPANHLHVYKTASYKNKSGHLFYSWGNEITFFHPDSIEYNKYIPPVVLTDFLIFNRSVDISDSLDGKPLLTRAIYDTQSITLPPGQTFSFEFAALDYTNPKKNLYAYKMEGLDEDWSPPGHQRMSTYTNLWEGDYTFRVKGSNNDGLWNEEGTSIKITILPPWYRSKLAYGFYGGLFVFALFLGRRIIVQKEREKARTQLNLMELEKTKELDQAKTQFFANISHEFRTPLTLILGPIKQMYEGTFTGDARTVLGVVIRNSQRLLHLVNQLLDFTKLEAGGVSLQSSVGDLVEFMRTMFSTFESTAQQRKINYMFQSSVGSLPAYFDRDKLEKVIINLLSNAFKFTKGGDTINLKLVKKTEGSPVDHGDGVVEIVIEDTGKGIAQEKLPHVFDRFYQGDESYTREQEGTGIGLALAKQLVELHYGIIAVASKKGAGTIFTIELPLGKTHLKEAEVVARKGFKSINTAAVEALPENHPIAENFDNQNGDLPILLIVEDNEDMRLYIREIFSFSYSVIEASNGETGIDLALEHTPDLIISDVMMPGMDGHQLCQKLKTDERTSHIPVVLLTARAGEEAKVEGLETGADDYITKPFSPVELKARVQNLIELRLTLSERFGKSLSLDPKEAAVTSIDQQFLERVLDIIEIHKSDTGFSAESFSREIGMSRSQLHRKLKALTGQSTGDFIRSYRLKYAKQLIKKGFGNVTQVAYESGFNSSSYFTECFRKQFGMTPSEYQKTN